ncbi:hypothetical protein RJ55_02756 [Drechmeria coniospora]|nr:hypothetical protein RJ55_02756 [Drechmeria coniospora]
MVHRDAQLVARRLSGSFIESGGPRGACIRTQSCEVSSHVQPAERRLAFDAVLGHDTSSRARIRGILEWMRVMGKHGGKLTRRRGAKRERVCWARTAKVEGGKRVDAQCRANYATLDEQNTNVHPLGTYDHSAPSTPIVDSCVRRTCQGRDRDGAEVGCEETRRREETTRKWMKQLAVTASWQGRGNRQRHPRAHEGTSKGKRLAQMHLLLASCPRHSRLSTLDSRLSTLDSRLSTLDSRLSTLDSRLSTLPPNAARGAGLSEKPRRIVLRQVSARSKHRRSIRTIRQGAAAGNAAVRWTTKHQEVRSREWSACRTGTCAASRQRRGAAQQDVRGICTAQGQFIRDVVPICSTPRAVTKEE